MTDFKNYPVLFCLLLKISEGVQDRDIEHISKSICETPCKDFSIHFTLKNPLQKYYFKIGGEES